MKYETAVKAASTLIKSAIVAERFGSDQEAHDLIQQAAGAAKILATIYSKWEETEDGMTYAAVWYDMKCAADQYGEEAAARFNR